MTTVYNEYKRVFQAVKLPPERRAEIRAALSSRLAETQKEDNTMHKTKSRRVLILAAAAIFAVLLVGFTAGSYLLLSGGTITSTPNSISMSAGFIQDPVEVRDGRIHFTLDGSDRDITEECSEEKYFQYEIVDETGTRQVIVVGGTPEDVGFALFVWLESGTSAATFGTLSGEGLDPNTPWLEAAEIELIGRPLGGHFSS